MIRLGVNCWVLKFVLRGNEVLMDLIWGFVLIFWVDVMSKIVVDGYVDDGLVCCMWYGWGCG